MGMAKGGNGFNPFKYVYDCSQLFRGAELPADLVLDFDGNASLTTMATMFFNTSGVKNLTIKNLSSTKTNLSMNAFLYISSDIETLTFENCNFAPSSLESFCRNCAKLTTVNGEIDCTNLAITNAASYWFQSSNALGNFRIKPNTLNQSPNGAWGVGTTLWSAESFVSLANGLNANAAGKTFTFHANQKTYIQSLMGFNSNGTFVASDSGTLSLADFITTVKGWTLE